MSQINDLLSPLPGIFRTIFLYVGQGESTLMIIPDGESHIYVLIDSNKDESFGGVDIAKFLKENNIPNDELIFINTHSHNDHINGIEEIHKAVGIKEIWHTGFEPGGDHDEAYKKLEKIIGSIGEGNVFYLRGTDDKDTLSTNGSEGSKQLHKLGDIEYQVFAPALYKFEEIEDEKPETRYQRIHEQCGVIKFSYENESILITGDSDKAAWEDSITEHHGENLKSSVLSVSHHCSDSFFKKDKDDQSYEEHIKAINPEYVIISAPKHEESPHGHPDKYALGIYKKYVGENNVYHLGEKRECTIIDIDQNGNLNIDTNSKVTDKYINGSHNEKEQICDSKTHTNEPKVLHTTRASSRPYCAQCE